MSSVGFTARHYALFMLLLSLRLLADWQEFPFDGVDNMRLSHAIEEFAYFAVIHSAFFVAFSLSKLSAYSSSRNALEIMVPYLFVHFLEVFYYVGGRATIYPPGEHLALNFLTAFIATGDAGFWQIARIFLCGALFAKLILTSGGRLYTALLGNFSIYTGVVLLTHPDTWIFFPEKENSIPQIFIEKGISIYLRSAYILLVLALLSRFGSSRARRTSRKRAVTWCAVFLAGMLFAPSLLEESSATLLLVLTLLLAVVRISLFSIRDFFQLWHSGCQNEEVGIKPWASILCLILATMLIGNLTPRFLLIEALLALLFAAEQRWMGTRDRYPGFSGLLDSLVTVGCVYAVI